MSEDLRKQIIYLARACLDLPEILMNVLKASEH